MKAFLFVAWMCSASAFLVKYDFTDYGQGDVSCNTFELKAEGFLEGVCHKASSDSGGSSKWFKGSCSDDGSTLNFATYTNSDCSAVDEQWNDLKADNTCRRASSTGLGYYKAKCSNPGALASSSVVAVALAWVAIRCRQ